MAKIFVCDDDAEILEMMTMMLEVIGHEVVTESNSLEAYKKIKRSSPDLMIFDLWMPMLTGTDLIKIVKSDPSLQHSPILAFSASRDGETLARDAGADDYLSKPFSIDSIEDKIKKLL